MAHKIGGDLRDKGCSMHMHTVVSLTIMPWQIQVHQPNIHVRMFGASLYQPVIGVCDLFAHTLLHKLQFVLQA